MRYATVFTQVWHDEKFRAMEADEKILFLYLLTSPHSNMCGIYCLPEGYACHDLTWAASKLKSAFKSLAKKHVVYFDPESNIVFIKNYLRYNPIKGKMQVAGAVARLKELPKNALLGNFINVAQQVLSEKDYTLFENTLSVPYRYPQDGVVDEVEEEAVDKAPPTPFQEIVAIYHKHCKSMTKVLKINKERKKLMKTAWDDADYDLEFFEKLFKTAAASSFLTGKTGTWAGANFDWLLQPKNYIKIIEGYYSRR